MPTDAEDPGNRVRGLPEEIQKLILQNLELGDLDSERRISCPTVLCMAVSPIRNYIVKGSLWGTISKWNPQSNEFEAFAMSSNADLWCLGFKGDESFLAVGNSYGKIQLLDPETMNTIRTLEGHEGGVKSVVFNSDGSRLVSGSQDKLVNVWDPMTGKLLCTMTGHKHMVNCVAFSPDSSWLVSGSEDKTVKVWDLSGRMLHNCVIGPWPVEVLTVSIDGRIITTLSRDMQVSNTDAKTGHLKMVLTNEHTRENPWCICTTKQQRNAWYCDVNANPACPVGHRDPLKCWAFNGDRSILATGSYDRTVKLWDPKTMELICTLKGHTSSVDCVAFSPDGSFLVSASDNGEIKRWDVWKHTANIKVMLPLVLYGK